MVDVVNYDVMIVGTDSKITQIYFESKRFLQSLLS